MESKEVFSDSTTAMCFSTLATDSDVFGTDWLFQNYRSHNKACVTENILLHKIDTEK